ncbi:type II toxin-antitoxin system Phd/YefM family antitoxin [Persicobacter diffluens]|uniref:Antitoxin n=1 Tax=Persicobacter diffluens TaxID=981 RepID=A0AAN4W2E9_9BACT|nr:hypothetical protein PEDI_41860 [Persicobacter diffluens]
MKVVTNAVFQKEMDALFDEVEESEETFLLQRTPTSNGVILLSLKEYNSILETLHLFSTSTNWEALNKSMRQFKAGESLKTKIW